MKVEIIATNELGDRSYVVHDGTYATVIDPQRDIDRVVRLLEDLHLSTDFVLETHIHNDYVTGGLALSQVTGAIYGISADDPVAFEHKSLADGDVLQCGTFRINVVATPGHTNSHLAYVVEDADGSKSLFSGGSLLYGSVGRTDLLGSELTVSLTHAQFHSARHLAEVLDDDVALYPTHGFGSFCSSGEATGGDASTIGIERMRNDVLLANDEESFVERLIANLTAYPSYYAHMGPRNLDGPAAPDLSPISSVDPIELARRIRNGDWIIDLRDGGRFAIHHLEGTVSIALGDSFSTYVGWLIPWGSPLTLIAETEEEVRVAQRQLVRIGIDEVSGKAVGSLATLASTIPIESYRVATFAEIDPQEKITVLDVRREDELALGFIEGSIHLSLIDLIDHVEELPHTTLWVHCASGFRASIAASLLARSGRSVVLINDDFESARTLGLTSA